MFWWILVQGILIALQAWIVVRFMGLVDERFKSLESGQERAAPGAPEEQKK